MKSKYLVRPTIATIATIATFALALASGQALAGAVGLSNAPLVTGLTKAVPPNVYFILDDSTSMSWDYMPDSVTSNSSKNCFRNFGYNKVYYNPATTYVAPKKADGTNYPDSSFNSAKEDGFCTSSCSTSNLAATTGVTFSLGNNPYTTTSGSKTVTVAHSSHGFQVGESVSFSPSRTFRGVTINGSYTIQSVTTNSYTITAGTNATSTGTGGSSGVTETFQRPDFLYYEYTSSPTSPPSTCASDSSYRRRVPSTAAEKTNFANWYSYYSTRINLMKSAAGRAFDSIDGKYRVGFGAISEKGTASSGFLNIKKFEGTHRTNWYKILYDKQPFNSSGGTNFTPLRGALSKAGRLYAGTLISGDDDPVQFSCQQNFTILTTDGYWNTRDEATSGTKYGPYKEDNTNEVGDVDGATGTARPFLDDLKKPNTLADIAYYYWKTDLRDTGMGARMTGGLHDDLVTRVDVTANNVPSAGIDTASHQHMTTFGLGMGVSGVLNFTEAYLSGTNADYNAILQGTKSWPDPKTSPLQSGDTAPGITERIDDLWHASVNGRGQYLSAATPDALVQALNKALSAISQINASSAAAATSSLEPVAGDNYAFVAQFTTVQWSGDLLAKTIDVTSGALSSTSVWSANSRLATKVGASSDTRTIYTYSSATTSKLKPFDAANLTAEKTAGHFNASKLSQYGTWDSGMKTAGTADAMIAFLRGQSGLEDEAGNANRLFRDRSSVLGDIVNAAPVYVKKPPFKYGDPDYASFLSANATRTGVVYVGANDGMLHAFNAETGNELWAYVPSAVIPRLHKLADATYAGNHEYFVDGPLTVGDAYDGTDWKTILVGGLGLGGRAYFALDVTDPANPKALWEFDTSSDSDLGYTYGNPLITKRLSDGKWVAVFASGYNNTAGDSKGRLFVVDVFTGAKLQEIVTDDTVTDPDVSGIAKVSNWVLNTLVDNSTQYVYGGDLGGSLWRFDLTGNTSQRLGRTSATVGEQPITVRPELSRIRDANGNYHRVVYFGTGRYLGLGDLAPSAPSSSVAQAIYAVKDTGSYIGVLTASASNLVQQTLDSSVTPRTIPNPVAVDWTTKNGWYLELPVGERVNIDPRLQLGVLVVAANAPKSDYCVVGGTSWAYSLDFRTGGALSTSVGKAVGRSLGNATVVGLTIMKLNNKLVSLFTMANTETKTRDDDPPPPPGMATRRVGWREIF
jgi:type IV pilus assembly protein PilY1